MRTGARSTAITTSGGTFNVDMTLNQEEFVFTGSGSQSGGITIAQNGTPVAGVTYKFKVRWLCTFALNGQTDTVLGITLTSEQASSGNILFDCVYIGGALKVNMNVSTNISPKNVAGVNYTTLTGAGGTKTLIPGIDKQVQVFIGNGDTMSSGWTITAAGSPSDETQWQIIWLGNLTIGTGGMNIFGITLTALQILNGGFNVTPSYDLANTSYRMAVSQNPSQTFNDYGELMLKECSLLTGEVGNNPVQLKYSGIYQSTRFYITGILTSDATAEIFINNVSTGVAITITSAGMLDDEFTALPTVPVSFVNGDLMEIRMTGGGGAGRVNAQVYSFRTP